MSKITNKVKADFETVYGSLEVVNEDVLANEEVYVRFFSSIHEYESIKSLLPEAELQEYGGMFYIVVDRIQGA